MFDPSNASSVFSLDDIGSPQDQTADPKWWRHHVPLWASAQAQGILSCRFLVDIKCSCLRAYRHPYFDEAVVKVRCSIISGGRKVGNQLQMFKTAQKKQICRFIRRAILPDRCIPYNNVDCLDVNIFGRMLADGARYIF